MMKRMMNVMMMMMLLRMMRMVMVMKVRMVNLICLSRAARRETTFPRIRLNSYHKSTSSCFLFFILFQQASLMLPSSAAGHKPV